MIRRQFSLDTDRIVDDIVNDARARAEGGQDTYDAAADAVAAHLDRADDNPVTQMYVVETLLATRGLDVHVYREHLLEQVRYETQSRAIVAQLYRNGLLAVVLYEAFDEPRQEVETRATHPPQSLEFDIENTLSRLEAAAERGNKGSDGWDVAAAVEDALNERWDTLAGQSLTAQVAIIEHLVSSHDVTAPTPTEQLRAALAESTNFVIGSLLWHTLAAALEARVADA